MKGKLVSSQPYKNLRNFRTSKTLILWPDTWSKNSFVSVNLQPLPIRQQAQNATKQTTIEDIQGLRPNYTQSFLLVTIVQPRRDFRTLTPSGLVLATNSVLTFLSPISSSPKIPFNPASPDDPPALSLLPTSQPPTINPDLANCTSIGSQFSISSLEASQSKNTQELPPLSSFLSDVRPLLSRPNHLKLQPDHSVLGRQHIRDYYTNHARRTKRPRFNQHLQTRIL